MASETTLSKAALSSDDLTAPGMTSHTAGDKYPIWLRLSIIVSLSGMLWAAIILGVLALWH